MNEHPQDPNDSRDPHDAAGTTPDADTASNSWQAPAPNENIPPAPAYFPEYAPPQHGDTAPTDAYPQASGFGVGPHDQPTGSASQPTEAYPAFAGTHQQFSGQRYPQNAQNTHPYPAPFGAPTHGVPGATRPAGKAKRRSTVGLLVAGLAVGALVGGATGAGTAALLMENDGTTLSTGATGPRNITINDTSDVTRATAIAATASPSVVTLAVQSSDSGGSGSGIVLSKDGYVLTNNHVVTLDGKLSDAKIQVTDNNGKLYSATVVGTDPIYDLAVIKLEGASDMTPIEFADSDKLNVGDVAVAIGAPLGLAGTVTDGIVSALNRSITVASSAVPNDTTEDDGSGDPFFNFPGQDQAQAQSSISLAVVQTDAAINPGNSGGALVDSDGKLIGVNVAIASAGGSQTGDRSGNIGVGFAITSNIAKRVADEIIKTGEASHGLLGASVGDAAKAADSSVVGALMSDVSSGGAAANAGLAAGDIVTSFDGKPITNATDLTAQVRALAAGATAEVIYVRGNETKTVDVTLGELVL
jgi:putative serine protease PepD